MEYKKSTFGKLALMDIEAKFSYSVSEFKIDTTKELTPDNGTNKEATIYSAMYKPKPKPKKKKNSETGQSSVMETVEIPVVLKLYPANRSEILTGTNADKSLLTNEAELSKRLLAQKEYPANVVQYLNLSSDPLQKEKQENSVSIRLDDGNRTVKLTVFPMMRYECDLQSYINRYFKDQPLDPSLCIFYAVQIFRGLEQLNNIVPEGFIHRDLKAENLLVDENGARIRICDFGTAIVGQKLGSTGIGQTSNYGTNMYYTLAFDIKSIGNIVYRLLSHKCMPASLQPEYTKEYNWKNPPFMAEFKKNADFGSFGRAAQDFFASLFLPEMHVLKEKGTFIENTVGEDQGRPSLEECLKHPIMKLEFDFDEKTKKATLKPGCKWDPDYIHKASGNGLSSIPEKSQNDQETSTLSSPEDCTQPSEIVEQKEKPEEITKNDTDLVYKTVESTVQEPSQRKSQFCLLRLRALDIRIHVRRKNQQRNIFRV